MIPSYEGHLACCLQGVGWCLMPTMTVEPLVASGKLVELVDRKRVNVSLHWQSRSQQSDVLKNLTDIVTKVAARRLVPDQFRATL
jgi:LysR family transcriptional regulator (chromosome initiation inhibitor)